jgi:hypothetical protein
MKVGYLAAGLFFALSGAASGQSSRPDAGPVPQLQLKKAAPGSETKIYRVRRGDYVYKILRREFETARDEELAVLFSRLKQLNPAKKDWNLLIVGEALLLPGKAAESSPKAAVELRAASPSSGVGAEQLPAVNFIPLIQQAASAVGGGSESEGEEIVTLPEGSVFLDRRLFPIVASPFIKRRVILDPGRQLPDFLRSALENRKEGLTVLSIRREASLREVVEQLLARLGFDLLPANRPVTVQDGGVALRIRGDWMVMAPVEAGQGMNVWIINLTDEPGLLPAAVKTYLLRKGITFTEMAAPPGPGVDKVSVAAVDRGSPESVPEQGLPPAGKAELVDAVLRELAIPFESGREFAVTWGEGIRLQLKVDRYFEFKDAKFGLLFAASGQPLKSSLMGGLKLIEMDLEKLSSRDVVARLLSLIGEPAPYQEHSFPFGRGRSSDRLVLNAAGFLLPQRSLFITDRKIPDDLKGLFSEKGMKVAYFQ